MQIDSVSNASGLGKIIRDLDPEAERIVETASREDKLNSLSAATGIEARELLAMLAHGCGLPLLTTFEPDLEGSTRFPDRLIHSCSALPIRPPEGHGQGRLCLATLWPPSARMERWVYAVCGREVDWFLVEPQRLTAVITKSFGVGAASLDESDTDGLDGGAEDEQEDENAAIIRFVNEVIQQAMRDRATDIHFEPRKEHLDIRYRIDGRLVPVNVPPNLVNFQSAIISRIKIMSRMNISEKRRPQDGRITYGKGRQEVDVRVSTLPTMYGESVSMRLLNEQSQPTSIQELGFLPDDEARIAKVLDLPHGIMLITGPTGSGKSTTLASFMRQIGTPDRRIITVEDPIEYEIPQINQTQVNSDIGLTFASALRSVLRQDPDVIMVGEIRDRETADIAVRASLTGHLVLSTLHTNDAPGAIVRLVDMGIEPFLIASSVKMVIAQRLIRRLCPHCAIPDDSPKEVIASCLMTLGMDQSLAAAADGLRLPAGCDACAGLGFRGRVGMFELLQVDETIHGLIVQRASAHEIRRQALLRGMRSLQACGWEHAANGRSALSEVMRYADMSESAEG
ncbi:putative type II secretion system protein HxcR [Pontiella desulfatans]|uniref:Putative type II secretion system protein HxcR n=1 Tax=Pontiella desulfatans TaxID=2750659 RepID=A0A6C2U320_PONDE|nr:GspE/PulE family protein [Pontiella desulfatans]VGO14257.1 putative type II secretion system protein HxcR [Pontiella desulfatans]